jgi:hypothetical protein
MWLITWLLYYLKCAFNICIAFIINLTYSVPTYFYHFNKNIKVNDYLYIVKVYGSYYDMGKQYGEKMKDVIKKDTNIFLEFSKENQNRFLGKIPKQYQRSTLKQTILEYYKINRFNLNGDVIQFMKGVAKTSGISYKELVFCNYFFDLMNNHCILLSKKINGSPFHLRTLDYGLPLFTQTLIVFNPTGKNVYCSLNLSFVFNLYTGFSEKGIFFGESFYDFKIGKLSYEGMPIGHISHLALSCANNIKDCSDCLKESKRKSNLQLLFADNENASIFLSCQDKFITQQEGDFVYSVTPKEKPDFDKNFHLLTDVQTIIKKFVPNTKSGELHIVCYYKNILYVSVTTKLWQSYNNTFHEIHLSNLFSKSL